MQLLHLLITHMSNKKYSTKYLEDIIKQSVLSGSISIKDISRKTGINNRTLGKHKDFFKATCVESGVTPVTSGRPIQDINTLILKIKNIISANKRWMSIEEVANEIGMTGTGLRFYIKNLNEMCRELGYPKLGNRGCKDKKLMTSIKEDLIFKYRSEISEKGSQVSFSDFCDRHNYSITGLLALGVNYKKLHEELGITYIKHLGYLPKSESIKEELIQYIISKNRYVTSVEFAAQSGYSKSTIYKAVGSVLDLNNGLGFYSINMGFEEMVFEMLSELFQEVIIIRQATFQDLISDKNRKLRFDFYLPELNLLVEADGPQHFDESAKHYTERLVYNDNIKNSYAEDKKITLIRVRWAFGFKRSNFLECFTEFIKENNLEVPEFHIPNPLQVTTNESITIPGKPDGPNLPPA